MKERSDDDNAAMKRAVKDINFGGCKEKEAAILDIKRLAKVDVETRRRLAEFGVIVPLVAMVVSSNAGDLCRKLAVEALNEIANGCFRSKKLIVEAGLLCNLPQLTESRILTGDPNFAHLLLSISSLARTQHPISSAHILPFLINILNSEEIQPEVKLTSLATLYNLSTKLENAKLLSSSEAVHALLLSSAKRMHSEKALAALGNIVLSSTGKLAIEDDPLVPEVFIEILKRDNLQPMCQELATYMLMVIAHRSRTQRHKMAGLGIVPVLLEVALLGNPLTRKRALKLLQWFKDEKDVRVGAHSGPQPRSFDRNGEENNEENRRAVKKMVRQSLSKNMESIMLRANGGEDCSRVKMLAVTSSSKSLPY